MNEEKPKGELFTHVYLERGTPQSDNQKFRVRIGFFCQQEFREYNTKLGDYLIQEIGLEIHRFHGYELKRFLIEVDLEHFLNAITLIWRFAHYNEIQDRDDEGQRYFLSDAWLDFVRRVIQEENMGYSVDERCGIHFLVDEEFEKNRASVLRYLDNPKYSGIRDAFEDAHRHFDDNPPDTKAAVRSMFESIEILIRKMVPKAKNLSSFVVNNELKPLVLSIYKTDEIAQNTIEQILDGFSRWVDGLHNYRHGQGKDDPVKPPMDFTIYVLSSGAAYLRWLVEIESKLKLE